MSATVRRRLRARPFDDARFKLRSNSLWSAAARAVLLDSAPTLGLVAVQTPAHGGTAHAKLFRNGVTGFPICGRENNPRSLDHAPNRSTRPSESLKTGSIPAPKLDAP